MTPPTVKELYAITEATWPPATATAHGVWTIRDGQGGGKRVSAATANGPVTFDDIRTAEALMEDLDQHRLFMIHEGEDVLDQQLSAMGYQIIDPVVQYVCPLETLTQIDPPRLSGFAIWPPLKIMEELWADGGIGPARLDVMRRVQGPKTAILGRVNDRAAGVAFVAIHNETAMLHAVEVCASQRRQKVAVNMMGTAAKWAQDHGAKRFSLVTTVQNIGSNALYTSLGMRTVGHYHYRIK